MDLRCGPRWARKRGSHGLRRPTINCAPISMTSGPLIAPATPCVAPPIGTDWLQIGDKRLPARASMGLLTQPISCIGLPVVTVPLWGMSSDHPHLPIGVQLIAAPWREDLCLRVAAQLQAQGLCSAPVAKGF